MKIKYIGGTRDGKEEEVPAERINKYLEFHAGWEGDLPRVEVYKRHDQDTWKIVGVRTRRRYVEVID